MRALTFHEKGVIRYDTVPDPKIIQPDDAIVKVELTAICGSDLHVYHGREKGLDPGTVMGHEFIGEVAAVGAAVQCFRPGERVFSPFFSACGHCYNCESDLSCRCERGHLFGWVAQGQGLQGAQAEYVRVPLADSTLHAISKDLSPEAALLLCDILPTGFFCAEMASPKPDGVYVVIGCGPVGLMAILGLRELGAERIHAIDLIAERRRHAQAFGALPLDPRSALDALLAETGGRRADAVLEVVGHPAAQRLAYDMVRPGGTISTVGVHTSEAFAFSPVDLYDKNLSYRTGRCPVQRYVPRLIGVLQSGKCQATDIITHRWPLSSGEEGYRVFDEKRDGCLKMVLAP